MRDDGGSHGSSGGREAVRRGQIVYVCLINFTEV